MYAEIFFWNLRLSKYCGFIIKGVFFQVYLSENHVEKIFFFFKFLVKSLLKAHAGFFICCYL